MFKKIIYSGCAGKSKVPPLTNQNKHASAWTRTQWMHKAPMFLGTFNTELKHQRLRTAFSGLSREHIWNLPAIYTLVIYKQFSPELLTKWHCMGLKYLCHGIILDGTQETCCCHTDYKKHNKYYNCKLCCGADDLDARKPLDILFIFIWKLLLHWIIND